MPIDNDLGSKHDLHISSTTPFFRSRLDRDMRERQQSDRNKQERLSVSIEAI